MATNIWKIESGLCRCCHAEGSFNNLAEPRTFMAKEEIYSDMLRDSLDIEIDLIPGDLCAITYTICNACVVRLRDACNFKKQVLDCEERFMALYYTNAIQALKSSTLTVVKTEPNATTEDENIMDARDMEFKTEDSSQIDDDDDRDFMLDNDDDDISDDDVKLSVTSRKIKNKAKVKAEKKEKATVKIKKKTPEEKPKPEKRGEIYGDCYTSTMDEDGTQSFICNICQSSFKKRNCFSQHYKHVHLKQRPKLRSCHLCNVKVPGYMRAFHMEEHGLPAPSCGACGKKFAYPFQVLRHQKFYHMGERRFRCDQCDLGFKTKNELSRHTLKHVPERPFKCDICGKKFRWKNNLNKHMMIHLNIRPHVCKVCKEAFVQITSLKWHIKKRHPEMERF